MTVIETMLCRCWERLRRPRAAGENDAGPRREARLPGAPALLAGLLAAPLAWFVQVGIIETLASESCFAHDEPLPQPWLRGALTAIALVSVLCSLVGIAGAALAWRNRRIAATAARDADAKAASNRALLRRMGFVTRVSLIAALLFVAGLAATDVAALIVSPCSRW